MITIIDKYSKTDKGGRAENQDALLVEETPNGQLFVVCDGMGGRNGGKKAAELAIRIIHQHILKAPIKYSPQTILQKAIKSANYEIVKASKNNPQLKGMGTTIAAVLIKEHSIVFAHVGDSRIYHLRNKKILYKTTDHSRVAEMFENKIISEKQTYHHPQANIITRALGIKTNVDVEVSTRTINAKQNTDIRSGDVFLICSDGISGEINEQELQKLYFKKQTLKVLSKQLINQINSQAQEKNQQNDNLSLIAIKFGIHNHTKTDNFYTSIVNTIKKNKVHLLLYSLLTGLIILLSSLLFSAKKEANSLEIDIKSKAKTIDSLYYVSNKYCDGLDALKNPPPKKKPNKKRKEGK